MNKYIGDILFSIRNLWFIHFSGLISAICYYYLSSLSKDDGNLDLAIFYPLLYLPWLVVLVVYFFHCRRLNFRVPSIHYLSSVIVWALVFRIIALFSSPIYEDDFYRFLWDGYQTVENLNPYGSSPMSFFGDTNTPEKLSDVLDFINYPHLPTIYAPVLQYVFGISYLLAAAKLVGLKLLFLLFEVIMLFALYKLLRPRNFFLAAWCPLLVFESTFQAHPDIIGACFISLGLLAVKNKSKWKQYIYLGFAVSSKIFAVIIAPFWLSKKHWFKQCIVLGVTILFLYLPFLLQGSDAGWYSLRVMAEEWEFNSFLLFITSHLGVSGEFAKSLGLAVFTIIYILLLFTYWNKHSKNKNEHPPLDIVFGSFFVLSPVINPWYLIWLFPFVMLRPRFWSITAMVVVSLSYTTGFNLGGDNDLRNFEIPSYIMLIQIGAITIALCIDVAYYCFWNKTSLKSVKAS